MGYRILNRRELILIIGIFCAIVIFCAFGTQKIAVDAMANIRSLPIYSVETKNQEKLVSLGINCAWGDGDIDNILSILDFEQVKATFFLVGDFCDKHPEAVKKIYEHGHEIGNHSDTHPDMPSISEEKMRAEIENCSDKIKKITGKKPRLFRAPSGAYNDNVIDTATELGYYPIQWSLDSLDWKDKTPQEMEARIIPKLTYGDILLFHNDTQYTSTALQGIIEKIKASGYEFKTVGELIFKDDYKIDATGRQLSK